MQISHTHFRVEFPHFPTGFFTSERFHTSMRRLWYLAANPRDVSVSRLSSCGPVPDWFEQKFLDWNPVAAHEQLARRLECFSTEFSRNGPRAKTTRVRCRNFRHPNWQAETIRTSAACLHSIEYRRPWLLPSGVSGSRIQRSKGYLENCFIFRRVPRNRGLNHIPNLIDGAAEETFKVFLA